MTCRPERAAFKAKNGFTVVTFELYLLNSDCAAAAVNQPIGDFLRCFCSSKCHDVAPPV